MPKILAFNEEARRALERGVDALANTVKVDGDELLVKQEDDLFAVVEK